MRKTNKTMIIVLVFLLVGSFIVFSMAPEKEIVTSIDKYEEVLGENGKYRDNYFSHNEIWPTELPDTIDIQSFYYEYYNPFDPNLLVYLKISYTDERDYLSEIDRLKSIKSTEHVGLYGAEGFQKELVSDSADDNGFIYALTDKRKQEISYVQIQFCNYFTDIDNFDTVINADDLPKGLDISEDNPTRLLFEKDNGR